MYAYYSQHQREAERQTSAIFNLMPILITFRSLIN